MKKAIFLLIAFISFSTTSVFAGQGLQSSSIDAYLHKPLRSAFSLPPIKSREEKTEKVYVKKIQLRNNTVLNRKQVAAVIKPLMKKWVTFTELERVRLALSKLYFDAGYINSAIYLPKQSYKHNTVVFTAIEGQLPEVLVSGVKQKEKQRIKTQLITSLDKPLNINQLQYQLNLLNNSPAVNYLQANLQPGNSPGGSVLKLNVQSHKNYTITTGVDNHRPSSVGAERAYLAYQQFHLGRYSDSLYVQLGLTKGMKDFVLQYNMGLPRYASQISTYYVKSDVRLIDPELLRLGITNTSDMSGFNWQYDMKKHSNVFKFIGGAYENVKSDNSLLGKSQENVMQLSAQSVFNWRNTNSLIDTSVRFGRADITFIDQRDSQQFTTFKLKTRHVKFLVGSQQQKIQIRTFSQISATALPAMERIATGGFNTVRGYQENSLVSDNAVVLNLEYVFKTLLPATTATMFMDAATVWEKANKGQSQLLSIGGGINWYYRKAVNVNSFIGLPLIDRPQQTSGNLQDFGVHFSLKYHY